jgi:hypothetical protein
MLTFEFFGRCLCIAVCDYPREASIGADIASAIFYIPFVLWAAYLIWA